MKASDIFSLVCAAFAAVTVVVESNRLDESKAENVWLQGQLSTAIKRGNDAWARCSVPLDGGVVMSYYWRPVHDSCPGACNPLAWGPTEEIEAQP